MPTSVTLSPLEVALRDQEDRWRQGQRVPVEALLARMPELAGSEACADLIYAEIMLRESSSERPEVGEYLYRFPHLADRITVLFELHEALVVRDLPATEPPATPSATPTLFDLAGYDVLEEIGHGGMAKVYRARDRSLGRIVAIKMLHAECLDEQSEVRLRREAETIARTRHPNVVEVYEIGRHEQRLYLVLEFIDGGTLSDRLRTGPLDPSEAVSLVADIARAVQSLHERGVIHRDLKPSNILLRKWNGGTRSMGSKRSLHTSLASPHSQYVPIVSDFGLAKTLDQTGLSLSGQWIGTPNYMAPELASSGTPVGPATDVYALGVILYELLTGRPPFQGDNPISVLAKSASAEPIALSQLRPSLSRDLEAVCLKCLEKQPQRRYASAEELAEDLCRYDADEPTKARPLSTVGRIIKLVRRKPVISGLVGAIAVSLAVGLSSVLWQWRQAVEARQNLQTSLVAEAEQRRVAEQNLYFGRIAQSSLLWENSDTDRARDLLADCRPDVDKDDWRGWEWNYLNRLFHQEVRVLSMPHWVNDLSPLNNGSERPSDIAVAVGRPRMNNIDKPAPADGLALIFDPVSAITYDSESRPPLPGGASAVAIHRGRSLIAWGTTKGQVVVAELVTNRIVRTLRAVSPITSLAFTTLGDQLIVGTEVGSIPVFDTQSGDKVQDLHGSRNVRLAMNSTGSLLACGGEGDHVQLYALPSWKPAGTLSGYPGGVTSLVFGSPGQTLFAGTGNGSIVVRDADTQREQKQWKGHTGAIYALALHANQPMLATGSADRTLKVWNTKTGEPISVYRGHSAAIRSLAPASGSSHWLSGSQDHTLRVWDATQDPRGRHVTFHPRLNDIAIEASEAVPIVRAVHLAGGVQSWSMTTGQNLGDQKVPLLSQINYPRRYTAFLRGGRWLAVIDAEDSKRVQIVESDTGHAIATLPAAAGPVITLGSNAAGDRLVWVAGNAAGTVDAFTWEAPERPVNGPFTVPNAAARSVTLSPNGESVAVAGVETVWVLDATGRKPARKVIVPVKNVGGGIAFSLDNRTLAVAVEDGVHLYDASNAQLIHAIDHLGMSTSLTYSPDGRRLAAVGYDGVVTLVDPVAGKVAFQLRGLAAHRPGDAASDARVAFSADGRWLVSTNWDGSLNFWNGSSK